jgi:hypothetical protein
MTYVLDTRVNFWLCDENYTVISSKVHYESIFFLDSSIIFNMIPNKIYYNMDN